MSIKQRVEEFAEFKKISIRKFEYSCGLSNGYFNNLKNSIGHDKLKDITLRYPELNPIWLMMGEGTMLKMQHKIDPEKQDNLLNKAQFESKGLEQLNKIIDRLLEINDKLNLENDNLKDELEELKKRL